MGCTSPLKAWTLGLKENGKKDIKVTSYKIDYLFRLANGSWEPSIFDNYSTKDNFRNSSFYLKNVDRINLDFQEIPCGKCDSCRIARSRQWALRCVMESLYHDQNSFITLTYNDENLPPCNHEAANFETGELCEESFIHSLKRKDVQDFLKRLRRHEEYHNSVNNIRYFGCGEYGPKNYRPHYHIILFGFYPRDLVPFKKNHLGQIVYRSPLLEKLWGKGFVSVGECNFETAAYTARYITKKFLGSSHDIYQILDYVPEFSMMSLKPGIGSQYYHDHKDDIYKFDELILNRGLDKSIKGKPPKYFDRLYDLDNPEHMEEIKDERIRNQLLNRELTISQTGLTWEQVLKNRATNLKHKYDMLKRTL